MYGKVISNLNQPRLKLYVPFFDDLGLYEWKLEKLVWTGRRGKKKISWDPISRDENGMWVSVSKEYLTALSHDLFAPLGIPCKVFIEQKKTDAKCHDACANAERELCECSCGGDTHKMGLEGPNVIRFEGIQIKVGVKKSTKIILPPGYTLKTIPADMRIELLQGTGEILEKRESLASVA